MSRSLDAIRRGLTQIIEVVQAARDRAFRRMHPVLDGVGSCIDEMTSGVFVTPVVWPADPAPHAAPSGGTPTAADTPGVRPARLLLRRDDDAILDAGHARGGPRRALRFLFFVAERTCPDSVTIVPSAST